MPSSVQWSEVATHKTQPLFSVFWHCSSHTMATSHMEDARGCPYCGTQLSVVPELQLRYSTCCGAVLCVDCITSTFRGRRAVKAMPCTECGTQLTMKSFVEQTFGRQKYDLEARHRSTIANVYVFHSSGSLVLCMLKRFDGVD